jgi:hypothetical protein
MKLVSAKKGYEVWAKWDREAQVWELFTEREAECYIGCADTLAEAVTVGYDWIDEKESA